MVDGIAETHGGDFGGRRIVDGGVERFDDADPVDPVGDARGDDREQLDEAGGVDAAAEDRGVTAAARLDDAVAPGAEAGAGDELRCGHDIDAGGQDADQFVDVGEHRVVDHAVGPQRQQRVDIIGGGDADRCDAAQRADVDTDLVLRPCVAADEFEVRVGGDRVHRLRADVARRPLHDPVGHAADR